MNKMFIFVHYFSILKTTFSKEPWFFCFGLVGGFFFSGKWYLETRLWVLAVLVAPELNSF